MARLLLLAVLALEVGGTLWLACTRLYQVDEAQTVYMAAVLAHGWKDALFTSGQLHLFPFSLLVRPDWSSSQIFLAFRVAFWALSWVNVALTVAAAGISLRKPAGLVGLVLAGSLAPWWAYALECRHDNVLIFGVLLLWIVGRRVNARSRIAVFFGIGAISLLLQACLFKSIVTWAPASALLLLVEPAPIRKKAQLAGAWVVGAVTATALAYGARAWAGLLGTLNEGAGALGGAMAITRESPFPTLLRLVEQAPLLTIAMVLLVVQGVRLLRAHGFRHVLAAPGAPEIGLFLIGILAFLVNPTPFPYNLAVLSGLALVAILNVGVGWGPQRVSPYLIAAAVVVLHVVPLGWRVAQLARMRNDEQVASITLAEAMTAPTDPVFDAIGLVPTRQAPSYMWFVNLTNREVFRQTSVTRSWGKNLPPVILASYRFVYLQPEDGDVIRTQYVPLRRDFFVLGAAFTQPGIERKWTCRRAGRYAVIAVGGAGAGLQVDGQLLAPGFYDMKDGEHDVAVPPDSPALLVWAGPILQTYPSWRPNQGSVSIAPVPSQL